MVEQYHVRQAITTQNDDLHNFKGVYFENDFECDKYVCPQTGAHFKFQSLYDRLANLQQERKLKKSYQEATQSRSSNCSENFGDEIDEQFSATINIQKLVKKTFNRNLSCAALK